MILYRADSREPQIIKDNGFQIQDPSVTLYSARSLILEYCQSPKSPIDLSRLIISSPQPQFISTDPDEDCGGYSGKGYIYKIEINMLWARDWSNEVLDKILNLKPNFFWPKLLLNSGKLNLSTVIALQHYGLATREVTFLTGISPSNIVEYKNAGDKAFTKM